MYVLLAQKMAYNMSVQVINKRIMALVPTHLQIPYWFNMFTNVLTLHEKNAWEKHKLRHVRWVEMHLKFTINSLMNDLLFVVESFGRLFNGWYLLCTSSMLALRLNPLFAIGFLECDVEQHLETNNVHITVTFWFHTHSLSTYNQTLCHVCMYIHIYVCSYITFCTRNLNMQFKPFFILFFFSYKHFHLNCCFHSN